MMQGDAYTQKLKLSVDGEPVNPENLEEIEVMIGCVRKTKTAGEVGYDSESGLYFVELMQRDTFRLSGASEMIVRCKFSDERVLGFNCGTLLFERSASKEQL